MTSGDAIHDNNGAEDMVGTRPARPLPTPPGSFFMAPNHADRRRPVEGNAVSAPIPSEANQRLQFWLSVTVAITVMLAAFGGTRRTSKQPRAADTGPVLDYASPRLATHTSGHSESRFKGWKDLLFTLYGNIGKHRIFTMAGGITFYSIIALFPAIAALVAIYSLFADPAAIRQNLDELGGILPGGAIQVIGGELHRIAAQRSKTLGSAFAIGFAVALWSANSGIKALLDALNLVYDETERRGFIRLNAVSLLFTLSAIGFGILATAALVAVPIVLNYVPVTLSADTFLNYVRWPALLLTMVLGLALLYRFGPSRVAPRWRWISWGSGFAAVTWLAASVLFAWYVAHFGTYNHTYGSLGAVMGFMVWIWISMIVILLGAEVDAELEQRLGPSGRSGRR